MPLSSQDGKLVIKSGALGTGQDCCCDQPSLCPDCNYPNFITFALSNLQTTALAPNFTAQEVADLTDAVANAIGDYQMDLSVVTSTSIEYELKTAANTYFDGIYSFAVFSCLTGDLQSFFFSIADPDFYNVILPYFVGGGNPFYPGFGLINPFATPPAGLGGNLCSGFNNTLTAQYLGYEGNLLPGRNNLFTVNITLDA